MKTFRDYDHGGVRWWELRLMEQDSEAVFYVPIHSVSSFLPRSEEGMYLFLAVKCTLN